MRLIIKLFTKSAFLAILSVTILTSCTENQSQIFIFKRYNFETNRYSYYKTDLYEPTLIEKINTIPCFEKDARLEPTWSPNGKYYGCSAGYDQPLIIYDINNKVIAKLEQGAPKDSLLWFIFGWSPDSQNILIMNTGSLEKHYYDVSIMKYDGTELHQIYKNTAGVLFRFGGWSPNGKHIVFEVYENKQGFFIIFDNSGKEIARYDLSQITHENNIFADQIIWSPDSQKLAFRNYYNIDTNSKLYVLDIESGIVLDIISDTSICIMNIAGWSPDSKKILFDAIDCQKHIPGDYFDKIYYSLNADGTDLKPLTEKGSGLLTWALDGKSILVSGYGIERDMYLMDTDGSNKRKLLDDGYFVSWIMP